jgi:hypothetical protein
MMKCPKKGDTEYSLEQNGEMKSEQFVYDSNRHRRVRDHLVAGSTTMIIHIESSIFSMVIHNEYALKGPFGNSHVI